MRILSNGKSISVQLLHFTIVNWFVISLGFSTERTASASLCITLVLQSSSLDGRLYPSDSNVTISTRATTNGLLQKYFQFVCPPLEIRIKFKSFIFRCTELHKVRLGTEILGPNHMHTDTLAHSHTHANTYAYTCIYLHTSTSPYTRTHAGTHACVRIP